MAAAQMYTQSANDQFGLPNPVVTMQGTGLTGLEYQIMGDAVPILQIRLAPGQVVYTDSGNVGWMSPNVAMNTRTHNGNLGEKLKHAVFGQSLFLVEYRSRNDAALVTFTAHFPGKIVPIHLTVGQKIMVQRRRFLCAEQTIALDISFQKSLNPVLGGIDFAMHQLSGSGVAFVCLNGDSVVYTLEPEQTLKVDPELVVMYDPTVTFEIEMLSGYKNILFSGKRLYHTVLRGPGRVVLQTMAIQKLARALLPHLPKPAAHVGERTTQTDETSM